MFPGSAIATIRIESDSIRPAYIVRYCNDKLLKLKGLHASRRTFSASKFIRHIPLCTCQRAEADCRILAEFPTQPNWLICRMDNVEGLSCKVYVLCSVI
jgi:hypothetical protein